MRVLQMVVLAVVLATAVGMWGIFYQQLPPVVPMFYSLPWGEAQLATKEMMLLIPGLAVVVAVVAAIGPVLFKLDHVLTGMVLGASIVAQLILAGALVRIVLLMI